MLNAKAKAFKDDFWTSVPRCNMSPSMLQLPSRAFKVVQLKTLTANGSPDCSQASW